ncbi:hypothetical protein [Thalassobacillus sp. CUG 92003]|uniref:hypothetical protein n=1 Tax=Thalassobacillus sp. CUG 92003 TaxID=2736641 RepID=UPI0015E779D6|nr:hypothetical protein [Thalassobacillus sp. CUG 92003]
MDNYLDFESSTKEDLFSLIFSIMTYLFTKTLRYQLENSAVHVFEIIPPLVDTEMTKGRGTNKISLDRLTDEFIEAFTKKRYEVAISKVKILKNLNRIAPSLAERIWKNQS